MLKPGKPIIGVLVVEAKISRFATVAMNENKPA